MDERRQLKKEKKIRRHKMEDKIDTSLFSYRLTQLETGLKDVQTTLQSISEQLNKMMPLQARVSDLEVQMDKLNEKVTELQNAPFKRDAGKWQTTISWILQALTLACMAVLIAKVGLK